MQYQNIAPFINRQEEIDYLNTWLSEAPNYILFLYGPKSSGKTTLIYNFIQTYLSDPSKYSVKHFNLREVLISSYEDFLQQFFRIEDPEDRDSILTREYNLKVFRLTVETQKRIKDRQLDPFNVMKKELMELNNQDIQPIIIIDELQALDFVYFNSQRELIKELINFFVAMTKESHLCHVLLSSSDGYFIEKLYNDSKLKKTSELFEVDYLPKEDIVYWLSNLEKESRIKDFELTDTQIEYIWEHFGGSIWEISSVLGQFLKVCKNNQVPDKKMQEVVHRYMLQARSYFEEYAALDVPRTELLKEIDKYVQDKGFVKEANLWRLLNEGYFAGKQEVQEELHYLVQQNFLYYNPALAEYRLQGRSMEIGLDMFVQELEV